MTAPRPPRNARAAGLVVAGIVAFCVNDAIVKELTGRLPGGEIVAVRGVFVVLILLAALPRLGMRPGRPDRWTGLRALGEVGVNAAFIASLAHLPLGEAYTLYFVAPILLTAAAALTGERVGRARWLAVAAGFAGVVVAVGAPGGDGGPWRPVILLPLLAAAFSVARDLATRRVPPGVGSGTVALTTAAAVALASALTLPLGGWSVPSAPDLALCLAAAAGAAAGYVLFVAGLRAGELSFVAPFRYAGIPAAMLLGLAVWGEVPTAPTLAGAAIIAGSGLLILRRERPPAPAASRPAAT